MVNKISDGFPRSNNLEWLRLIFALQVVVSHTISHLQPDLGIAGFIYYFPGVPAFFFVSGFLIYSSYLNAPGRRYFENRVLRLYPGLVMVTIGAAMVVLIAQGWSSLLDNAPIFLLWFVAQITIGQAYNPEIFRSVGIGVINGSLWTITTELLFYLVVPVIVWMEKRFRFVVITLSAVSFIIYSIGPVIFSWNVYRSKSAYDVIALTPLAWGWMFGVGIIAVKYYSYIRRWIVYFPVLCIPVFIMIYYGDGVFFRPSGNRLGFFYFVCYTALVLWFAFWLPYIKLGFDFSYGAYIWHAPILNLLLVLQIPSAAVAITLTLFLSGLSWYFVEKPMLKLKHQSLRPV